MALENAEDEAEKAEITQMINMYKNEADE